MEHSGRKATTVALFLATPVPLVSRHGEGRYWCDPGDAAFGGHAVRANVNGLDRFGCDDDWGDIGWSGVDVRSGH